MVKVRNIVSIFSLLFTLNSFAESSIQVDISEQRLYLLKFNKVLASYPISSSSFGEGQKENSYKTPLGKHIIKEMIGSSATKDTIFISRINTKRAANLIKEPIDTDNDYVTSRIM